MNWTMLILLKIAYFAKPFRTADCIFKSIQNNSNTSKAVAINNFSTKIQLSETTVATECNYSYLVDMVFIGIQYLVARASGGQWGIIS